ncbi:MAG: ribose 1,5-bisphosphate isomerase [Candidatus Aenigmatarchaeota archaeon]
MPELREMVAKIRGLGIQGAQEIAVESLKFLRSYGSEYGYGKEFFEAMQKLEEARPTAVVLHNCVEELKREPSGETIESLLANIRSSTKKIAVNAKFIKSGDVIMTHCHSGVAVAVLKHASASGKKISVIATETEPKHQGIKTATELAEAKMPVTLIADNAVSYFMPQVDYVLLGSDAMRREGNVNKIGSFNLALAAREFGKPYYVAASTLKLDRRRKIRIEMRPANEIYHSLKGVKILNPAFDITPWKLVSRVITEKGVMTPGNLMRLL